MSELLEFIKRREGYEEVLLAVEAFLDKKSKPKFIAGETHIPVTGKVIDTQDIQAIVAAALDGWLTTGRFNTLFERKLQKLLTSGKILTCNSGSSANLIAFSSLCSPKLGTRAIKPGDEVISVAAGFPTTINPIIQNNAIPVFIDVRMDTLNIDETKIEAAITAKTRAIFLAHTLGNPYNLNAIKALCEKYDLFLIEDTCDALGGEYDGKKLGTFGDIATLSFYPAHHITMGEGGAVIINNPQLEQIAESIRDWGRDCYCGPGKDNTCGKRFCWKLGELPEGYDHKYVYSHVGYNLKITDMQSACGLSQLDKLDNFIQSRKENYNWLKKKLSKYSDLISLSSTTAKSDPSWFGFPIIINDSKRLNRNDFVQYLNGHNIGTRLLFAGNATKQPFLIGQNYKVHGNLENTDKVMNDVFWIGVHPGLSEEMLNFMVEKIEEYLENIT